MRQRSYRYDWVMPRWEPDSRERLVAVRAPAVLEQGYDETTVAEIAQHAGLTKSTFFRYFPDKRDVLAAGQETLSRLFVEGISGGAGRRHPAERSRRGVGARGDSDGTVQP